MLDSERRGDGSRRSHWPTAALLVAALVLLVWGGSILLEDHSGAERYRALAEESSAAVGEGGAPSSGEGVGAQDAGRDWDSLLSQNGDCVAWLTVAGTSVDTPVVQSSASDPNLYLHHDFWGSYFANGCPYLDARCDADGDALVVYGHRTSYESYMFHDLSECYRQDAFDALGEAAWETPGGGKEAFRPAFAASIGRNESGWRPSSFDDRSEMTSWLEDHLGEASSRADDADALVASARRVMVLVTCNGSRWNPTTRTVVVFVAR